MAELILAITGALLVAVILATCMLAKTQADVHIMEIQLSQLLYEFQMTRFYSDEANARLRRIQDAVNDFERALPIVGKEDSDA